MDKEIAPIYDKFILYIDNVNVQYLDTTYCNFYIDIKEPIKNATHVKIISCSVSLDQKSNITNGDPVYVAMNDYKRISTVINNCRAIFFEMMNILYTNTPYYKDASNKSEPDWNYSGNVSYKSDFDSNDTSVYVLNPVELNLRRFNIQLYDKDNKILKQEFVKKFNIALCIYSSNKKY